MNTLKWIVAVLTLIICTDNVFAQNPVTASFNENKSEIIIQNNWSEIIYIYRRDVSNRIGKAKSSEKDTKDEEKLQTFDCLNVKASYVKVLPEQRAVFRIRKTDATQLCYYTTVGDNVDVLHSIPIGIYTPSVQLPEDKRLELISTKLKIDSIPNLFIKQPDFKEFFSNQKLVVEQPAINRQPETPKKEEKPTLSVAPSKEIEKVPEKKPIKEPTEEATQKEIFTPLRKEYQRIYSRCQSLINKEKLQDAEKQYLKEKQRELNSLRTDVINVKPVTSGDEKMKNDLLSPITSLIEHISEIALAKSKTIKEEFQDIYSKHNAQIVNLNKLDSEIEASVKEKLHGLSLTRWRNKESIYSRIAIFAEAVQISEKNFETDRVRFANRWGKEDKETFENLLIRQTDELNNNYNKLKYNASMYKKRIDELSPPYALFVLVLLVGLIVLIALLFYIRAFFRNRKIKNHKTKIVENSIRSVEDDKVEPVIFESGLDDVRAGTGDNEYYTVDMNTIFNDTAIEKVYISKNCILNIHRFFLEFLKFNGKTNETGCFVIGRWEQVTSRSYNISLEEIIEPGNDAVYGEYELDFGTQIGIGLESAIISSRQLTQKDYVHTCWIHSHPSIGLFLSNHDLIVQSQLVYSEHPTRMLAIVIDSNTDDLDTAFFTPKRSGIMNNKEDMKSILSFEKIAQWAKGRREIEQPQSVTYDTSNYYEFISNSPNSIIETFLFSGASIIDVDHIISPNAEGLKGYFYGKPLYKHSDEFLQKKVLIDNFCESKTEDNEVPIGCFLVLPYFTYQTVLAKYEPIIDKYDFFVVYNPTEDNIRIISRSQNGKYLIVSERDLTPIQMAEMRKWTRRRRV